MNNPKPSAEDAPISTETMCKSIQATIDNEINGSKRFLLEKVKEHVQAQQETIEKAIEILQPIRTMRFDLLENRTKTIVAEALAQLEEKK